MAASVAADRDETFENTLQMPDLESCLREPSPQLVEGLQKFMEKILAHIQVEDGSPGRLTQEEFGKITQQPSASSKTELFLKIVSEKSRDAHLRLVYALYGIRRQLLNLIHPGLTRTVSEMVTKDILGLISKRAGSLEERLHGGLGEAGKQDLTLLLIGRPGVGKSSLVNSIIGKKVAAEGCTLEAATVVPQLFKDAINGVHVRIWDTPGLRDASVETKKRRLDNEEDTFLRKATELREKIVNEGPPDLLLFCIDGSNSALLSEEKGVLRDVKLAFTSQIWRSTVFVLTKANLLRDPDFEDPDDASYLQRIVNERHSQLKRLLLDLEASSDEIVEGIPLVPVGSGRDLILADGKPWLPEFWVTCLERTKTQDAAEFLVHLNQHRLTFCFDRAEAGNSGDSDSDSGEDDDLVQSSARGGAHNAQLVLDANQTNRLLGSIQKNFRHKSTPAIEKSIWISAVTAVGVGTLTAVFGPVIPVAVAAVAVGCGGAALLAKKMQTK